MENEVIQSVISESTKYGLAVLILVVSNVAFAGFIFFMWKQQNKERQELVDVIKDNTSAYTSLQGTINTLIQVLTR